MHSIIFPLTFCTCICVLAIIMNLLPNKDVSVIASIVLLVITLCLMLTMAFRLIEGNSATNATNISNRKTISVKFIVCIGLVAVLVVITSIISGVNSTIKDTNGANNYNLNEITLDDIINLSVTPRQFFTSITFDGDKSLVTGYYEDVDFDFIKYSVKSLSGTLVLNATKVDEENLTLKVNSKVYSGNCRIIVTMDDEYYDEFELNKSDTMTIRNAKDKDILVIVAGEDTECEILLTRTKG